MHARGVITTAAYCALAIQAIDSAQGIPAEADPIPGGVHEPIEITHYTWAWPSPDDEAIAALVCDDIVEAMVPDLIASGDLPPGAAVTEIPWCQ